MIIKLDEKVDIDVLVAYLDNLKSNFKPFVKHDSPWGGWSVTSANGDLYDGWQPGNRLFHEKKNISEINQLTEFFENNKFDKPTQIYNKNIDEVIRQVQSFHYQFKLSRIRITLLNPHKEEESYWHADSDGTTKLRLHIPIQTNELCFFDYKNERHHLSADGSIYIVDVSKLHRVVNLSQEIRYHFIADIVSA